MRTSFSLPLLALATTAVALPKSGWNINPAGDVWKGVSKVVGWSVNDMETVLGGSTQSLGDEDKTIYQILKDDNEFTKLIKLIHYDDDIRKMLDSTSHRMTFFAPNNDGFPTRPGHDDDDSDDDDFDVHAPDALSRVSGILESLDRDHKDKDRNDRDKKRTIFKEILHEVLLYHCLPYEAKSTRLALNSTVSTALRARDGSFDGQKRRMKFEHTIIPPSLTINGYARVTSPDNMAKNGIVHVINAPLLPPPSVLEGAWLLMNDLSTLTSAIQKVRLDKALEFRPLHKRSHGKEQFEGNPSVTLFAPTNAAFHALPERLALYLFSPFGQRALEKLLKFHVVPDFHIYTEWIYNVRDEKRKRRDDEDDVMTLGDEMDFRYMFPTELRRSKMEVHIKKSMPTVPVPGVSYITFEVQGQQVQEYDFPARNGVFHIVNRVLDPRGEKASGNGWEDWEDWFVQWAEEQD